MFIVEDLETVEEHTEKEIKINLVLSPNKQV